MDIYYIPRTGKALDRGEQAQMLALKFFWMMVQPMVFWTNMEMLSRFGEMSLKMCQPFMQCGLGGKMQAKKQMQAQKKKPGQKATSILASFSTTSSAGLGSNNQVSCATMPTCSWEEAEAVHEEELQEHWALKPLWMNELRHVAIGGDGRSRTRPMAGASNGRCPEERKGSGTAACEVLERHRLASLVQNSQNKTPETLVSQAAGVPSSTVLQTYTVP